MVCNEGNKNKVWYLLKRVRFFVFLFFFVCVYVFYIIQNNLSLEDNDYNHNNY